MKTRTSFGYSAAALVIILLHVSTSTADTSDIILLPAGVTCDCCYISINSECCLECLARLTEVGGLAPLAEVTREAEFGDELGTSLLSSFGEGGVREPTGWLSGCRCCYRERLLRARNRHTILGASCCAFCLKSKSAILKLQLANAAGNSALSRDGYSVGGVGAATDGDVSGGGGGEGEGEVMVVGPSHAQKRISMDCMCCSNSGIGNCCTKCRLMA